MTTAAHPVDSEVAPAADRKHRKFLTFYLGSEEYGMEIEKVNEIIGMMSITPLPSVPKFIKGVINLRGRVIPVLDLRTKLGLPEIKHTKETCVVIVRDEEEFKGIIVDRVSEVLDIRSDSIDDVPEFGQAVNGDLLLGIARVEEKIKLLLKIEAALDMDRETQIMLASQTASDIDGRQ